MSATLKGYAAGSATVSVGVLVLTGSIGLTLIVAGLLCLLACGCREALS